MHDILRRKKLNSEVNVSTYLYYFTGPGKTQKRKKSRKQRKSKKRRESEENKYDYDSESTDIISDNDMPPLPSVQASTHSCSLVRENAFVGVDGFNAAMQKMRNERTPPHD